MESGTGNLTDPNSIHSNTGLGIDLGTDGRRLWIEPGR